jgi:hypothetical protein
MLHFLTSLPAEATDERYAARLPSALQHEQVAETTGRVRRCTLRLHPFLVGFVAWETSLLFAGVLTCAGAAVERGCAGLAAWGRTGEGQQ